MSDRPADDQPAFEFWFEFGSTYSYLSAMRLPDLAAEHGIQVEWRPFLLMPVLNAIGVPNPYLDNPPREAYMWRDLPRRAARFDIPWHRPSVYPPNSLSTARVARLAQGEGWCERFTQAAMSLHWQQDITIGTDANTLGALESLGYESEPILHRALTDINKAALKKQTEVAQTKGLFGAPSFIIGQELFWGDDRLEEAIDYWVESSGTGPRKPFQDRPMPFGRDSASDEDLPDAGVIASQDPPSSKEGKAKPQGPSG